MEVAGRPGTGISGGVAPTLDRIRVLSVPTDHVYVWHLGDPDGDDGVVRLPDAVVDPDNPMSPWWPPPTIDASWVAEHADEFDLVHVHFGFDTVRPADLQAFVAALQRAGKPLVYTVHDLRNPHHLDRELHDRQLDVLVPGADAVLTLTEGAAREIQRRWHRVPSVLPHPHVVPLDLLDRPRRHRAVQVVGVHLKSLRASMDPLPVVECLADALAERDDAVVRVDVHDEVLTRGSDHYDDEVARTLSRLAEAGRIDLRVHPFFTDDELWDYFSGLDLSVLPYRFGTHSGWLEACYDLGTPVVVPDCGYYADQRPCLGYRVDGRGPDRRTLVAAVTRGLDTRPGWRATRAGRVSERRTLAAAHRRLYERLLREAG